MFISLHRFSPFHLWCLPQGILVSGLLSTVAEAIILNLPISIVWIIKHMKSTSVQRAILRYTGFWPLPFDHTLHTSMPKLLSLKWVWSVPQFRLAYSPPLLPQDARVPVCPLCNQPVPVSRGEDPNIKVLGVKCLLSGDNDTLFVGCTGWPAHTQWLQKWSS